MKHLSIFNFKFQISNQSKQNSSFFILHSSFFILIFLFILTSCTGTTEKHTDTDSIWVAPVVENEILNLPDIHQNGTFTVRSNEYSYEYHFYPVDSLPLVINSDGQRYHDNLVDLTVKRGTTTILSRRFSRQSFTSMLSAKNMHTSALVGFSYNLTKTDDHSALHFIATVGDPDETAGINFPFDIQVNPDGTYSIDHARDIETEPLIEGLNQEPSTDGGV